MSAGLHISISAEPVSHVAGLPVTNSMLTSSLVSIFIIAFAIIGRMSLSQTTKPKGFQNIVEWIIESLMNLVESVAGKNKKSQHFFPFIATFFVFILLNNWSGLLPGVGPIQIKEATKPDHKNEQPHVNALAPQAYASPTEETTEHRDTMENDTHEMQTTEHEEDTHEQESHVKYIPLFRAGTADLNTTLALALISVGATQFFGLKFLHLSYLKKYFNFSSPIMFVVGLLEIVSELAKIMSFAFRLFGNIFAGEVLLVVITWLTKMILSLPTIPFYGLEIFVGFIQALVFSMLSLVFFNIATQSHDNH